VPNPIFAGKAKSPNKLLLEALLAKIRAGFKYLEWPNTLAYFLEFQ
jgi:hypothetical protein